MSDHERVSQEPKRPNFLSRIAAGVIMGAESDAIGISREVALEIQHPKEADTKTAAGDYLHDEHVFIAPPGTPEHFL